MLMLLELCEFFCAGTAQLNGAGLRCQKCGWMTFIAEGVEEPEAPPSGAHRLGDGGGLGEMSRKTRSNRSRIVGYFGAEGVVRCDTWLLQMCKGAPYEVETRGTACKGVSAMRRHAGGLYDAGSYCYTLVKCLKSFVRNGKGVIEVDDHAQGPPINSEPLVMKRTRSNEKRAPKAPASLSAFGLLSVSFFLSSFRDSRSNKDRSRRRVASVKVEKVVSSP
jgi:hypothetical protein